MRKIFSIGIMVMMVLMTFALIGENVSAAVTVYANDRPGWVSAVGSYDEEFFIDATLNPGVSVVTNLGYVDTIKQVWWDRLVVPDEGETTTTWQFATPLRGFGGYWNPGIPGGPGASIEVEIGGSWMTVGEIPSSYTGQFWGFVTTTSFYKVRLSSGSTPGAWCETYELDNMVYSYAIILDQSQTLYSNNFAIYSTNMGAQSFKPTLTTLSYAEVYMRKVGNPPGNLIVSIRSSLTGADLVSLSVPPVQFYTTFGWVKFDFSDISVTPGNTYYIVLKTSGGSTMAYYNLGYSPGNLYKNGALWTSYYGQPWYNNLGYDLCFKTYGFA